MGTKNWFFGTLFSLYVHGMVVLLVLLWGAGAEVKLREPVIISGELVSLSSLADPGPGGVKTQAPPKIKPAPEKRDDKPEPETPEPVSKAKPQPEEVKPKQQDRAVKLPEPSPEKEIKKDKEKPQKKPKPEPVKTEAVKRDVVPLNKVKTEKAVKKVDKKKQNTTGKKPVKKPRKKPDKKVAQKITAKTTPKPTPKTLKAKVSPAPRKSNEFEKTRERILEDMKTQRRTKRQKAVIKDIQKNVRDRRVVSTRYRARNGSGYGSPGGYSAYVQIVREYSGTLYEEISRRWEIPKSIPNDGTLRAEVIFRIDERGRVNGAAVKSSSGNHTFDQFCIQAIYKAVPLTTPPPELLEEARVSGIVVKFTNKSL